ncbi:MAG: MMPL family transporter [Pseudomonadales bacterium]|nr:MMPL family transporter [Pseudomonadales bacterium]
MNALIRYSNWCESSKLPILLVLLATVFFGIQFGNLGINASPYIVEQGHPLRKAHEVLSDTFTNSGEQVMVVIDLGENLFERSQLEKISEITSAFENLSLVDETDLMFMDTLASRFNQQTLVDDIKVDNVNPSDIDALKLLRASIIAATAAADDLYHLDQIITRASPVLRVRSLTTVENLTDTDDFLAADKLIDVLPSSTEESRALEAAVLDNELYHNILTDRAAHKTNVQLELNITSDDSPNMIRTYERILETLAAHNLTGQAHLSGIPVVNAQIGAVMENDNKTFFPFVILVIIFILYLTFKKLAIVFSTLGVAILTMVWTLGSMALLGIDQNIVTAILPIFLISIAVADSIHYISAYLFQVKKSADNAISGTNSHLMQPMFLTTITTVFGFLALSYSDLIFIKEFGLFVALGVAYAFIITITLLPLVLPRMRQPSRQETSQNSADVFSNITTKIFVVTTNNPRAFFLGSLIVISSFCYFATGLTVDNHSTASFNENTKIRQDERFITDHLGGIYPVNFWIKSETDRGLIRPDVVLAIEELQQHIDQFDQIGYTVSANDFLKRLNRVVAKGEYQLPEPLTQDIVSQFFLLYENSNGQDLRDVIDLSYSEGRIVALFKTDQASQFREVIESTQQLAKRILPADVSLQTTGYGAEIVLATDLVVHGQVTSIIIAITLIGGLMVLYYRSFLFGLIGILPLTLTIAINFGLMSLTNVPLDIGTALISGIAFGIGIDYSIHFISIFRGYCENTSSVKEAIQQTIDSVSRPIVVNSLSLGLGFLILSMSDFASLRQLGYFISTSMIVCAILTLFLLPFIFSKVAKLATPERSAEYNEDTKLESL